MDTWGAIADLAQGRPDFMPGQPALARNAAIVLAGVEMAEQRTGGSDRLAETVFLDVHMKRVEHDLDVGLAHFANEGNALFGGVQHVVFEAIEHFETEVHAAIIGEIREIMDAFMSEADRRYA